MRRMKDDALSLPLDDFERALHEEACVFATQDRLSDDVEWRHTVLLARASDSTSSFPS